MRNKIKSMKDSDTKDFLLFMFELSNNYDKEKLIEAIESFKSIRNVFGAKR